MRFLHPIGLLGLIGVPILVLIYILRSKYNEQTIASTYLWTLSEKFFKRRNPLSGLTGIISLILQILTVIILSLVLARPIFVVPNSASEYCFILDGSGSMNTENGNKTNYDKAKDYIENAIDEARLGSTYTLIDLSTNTSVVYERISDKKLAKEMLAGLQCSDGTVDESEALSKAQGFFEENTSTLVFFVTDKEFENSENLEIVNISLQNVSNYSISDVSGGLTDGTLSASGKVTSHTADAEIVVEMYVNGSKEAADTVKVNVAKGESVPVELSCQATSYDSFQLVITNDDNLDIDNEITCYNLNSESSYSILIVSDTPFFMNAVFDALTDSKIDVVSTSEYIGQTGYGLYVFHSYTPESLPDAAVWLINSSSSIADSGFGSRGIVELEGPKKITMSNSTSTKARKLLDGVSGRDIYISEYVKYSGMYTQFTTLFSYDSNPLIFAGVNALGNREVVIGFDLHKSDIALSSDFAALMSNLLKYSCPDLLDHTGFVSGEEAQINITANMDSVMVTSPDGEENYIDTSTDIGSLLLDKVGTYTITVSIAGSEKTYKIFSSAPISESDPDAAGVDFSLTGEQTYEKSNGEYDPLVLLFVLLAITITADWMVYCYEKYQLR